MVARGDIGILFLSAMKILIESLRIKYSTSDELQKSVEAGADGGYKQVANHQELAIH